MNLTLKSASPTMWLCVGMWLLAGQCQQSVQSQPAYDDQNAAPQPGKPVTMQLHRAVTVRGPFVGPFGEEKGGGGQPFRNMRDGCERSAQVSGI